MTNKFTTLIVPADKRYCGGIRVSAGAKDSSNQEWNAESCRNACFESATCKVAEYIQRKLQRAILENI